MADTVAGFLVSISPLDEGTVNSLVVGGCVRVNGTVVTKPKTALNTSAILNVYFWGKMLTFEYPGATRETWEAFVPVDSPTIDASAAEIDSLDRLSIRIAHLSPEAQAAVRVIESLIPKGFNKNLVKEATSSLFKKADKEAVAKLIAEEYTPTKIAARRDLVGEGSRHATSVVDEAAGLEFYVQGVAWLRGKWLSSLSTVCERLDIARELPAVSPGTDITAAIRSNEATWRALQTKRKLPTTVDEVDSYVRAHAAAVAEAAVTVDALLARVEISKAAIQPLFDAMTTEADFSNRIKFLAEKLRVSGHLHPLHEWGLRREPLKQALAEIIGVIDGDGTLRAALDETRRVLNKGTTLPPLNIVETLVKYRGFFEERLPHVATLVSFGLSMGSVDDSDVGVRMANLNETHRIWTERRQHLNTSSVVSNIIREVCERKSALEVTSLPEREKLLKLRYEADLMLLRGDTMLEPVARARVRESEAEVAAHDAEEAGLNAILTRLRELHPDVAAAVVPKQSAVRESGRLKNTHLHLNKALKDYKMVRKLGQREGSTQVGAYRHETWLTECEGREVALKKFALDVDSPQSLELYRLAENDILFRHRLQHPNIHRVEGYFFDDQALYMQSAFHPSGSLTQWLATHPRDYERLEVSRQLAQVVAFLHENSVVHGNLTPENVLMGPEARAELTDLHFAIDDYEHVEREVSVTTDLQLTFTAPEVQRGGVLSKASDMWSLGMLLFRLFFDSEPLPNRHMTAIEVPSHTNDRLVLLLEGLLIFNPASRLTARAALVHPFFTVSIARDTIFVTYAVKVALLNQKLERVGTFNSWEVAVERKKVAEYVINNCHLLSGLDQGEVRRISTRFIGEPGTDAGGLTKDFFTQFYLQIFTDKFPLMECSRDPPPTGATYLPAPNAFPKQAYVNLGRFFLRTMLHRIPIPPGFAPSFFKALLNIKPKLDDLARYDYSLSCSLRQLLATTGSENLCMDFSDAGQPARPVDDLNKAEFVAAMVDWVLVGSRRAALEAVVEGFRSPDYFLEILGYFSPSEFMLLVQGSSHIDADIVLANCNMDSLNENSKRWLTSLLRREDETFLRYFVFFGSALFSIPPQGLPQRIGFSQYGASANLPRAHNCSSCIDVYEYPDEQTFHQKFRYAVLSSVESGFGFS